MKFEIERLVVVMADRLFQSESRPAKPSKEEIDHVLRIPLPWRNESLTECGLDPKGKKVLTHETFIARCKDLGKTRIAMVTCMTCLQTTQNWLHAEGSLIARLGREIDRSGRQWVRPDGNPDLLENELRAIALLIDAHREEFDQALADTTGAISIDKLRANRKAKQRSS